MAGVRLSDEQVVEIRRAYEAGTTQVVLAGRYGISQKTVSSLVVGRSRRAAGGPITTGRRQKLTDDDVTEIRRLARDGASFGALATRFGVSPPTVTGVIRGGKSVPHGGDSTRRDRDS